jgi:hypothetical protein
MRLPLFEIERDRVQIQTDPQTTFAYSCLIDIIACHRIIFTPKAAIHSTALAGVEKIRLQADQKDPEARRAKNRRAEAYMVSTLQRGDRAQRSIWNFFSSLLENEAHCE